MRDVIIIGARCAGSPLGMLLARMGHDVLLVDKDEPGLDHPYSTLLLHPPGVAHLKQWGLLDRVLDRSGCRKIRNWHVDVGPFSINTCPPPHADVDFGIAPRRLHLDEVLCQAADESGVEVRHNYPVQELIFEGARVVGISGPHGQEKAKLVIGAEGASSLVARAVNAPEYNKRDPRVATYWAFWSGVQLKPGADMEFYPRVHRGVYAWPTSADWVLVGTNWSASEFEKVSEDPEGNYWDVLTELAPDLAQRVKQGKRESDFRGGFTQNFYRKPYGEGWALAGDAGSCYEFSTGQGITNVFRADQLLADAIHESISGESISMTTSLAAYEQKRNDAEFPYYDFTYHAATLQPPDEKTLKLFGELAENEELASSFLGLFSQTTAPKQFFNP